MNVIQEAKNDFTAAQLLADWLGDGHTVHPIVAELRAEACLTGNGGRACNLNVEPNWWDRVKGSIAETIRLELELKNGMSLHVPGEDGLSMCKLCGCCLRLKVWTPKNHLKAHITQKQIDSAPDWCWLRKELA